MANAGREELGLLVIEDDVTFARVVGELATRARFRPLFAPRGDVGLAMALQLRPAGILLDLNLPGVDGWSLLDRLKHDPATAHIPVLVMSGDARGGQAQRFGAFCFLEKPVEADAFTSALDRLRAFVSARPAALLVVEPDATRLAKLIDLLGGDDVAITEARSAAGATAVAATTAFDCAVIASQLPDGSVSDVARILAASKREAPIVVLARSAEELAERRGLLPAARVHLVVSEEQALERVVRLMHRRESLLSDRSRAALRRAQRSESPLKGRSVLVVDDDQPSSFALRSLLEAHGMRVMIAADGPRCLEILADEATVDAILMDIMLPDMDGYEVIRRIRTVDRFQKTPVLALTALAMKGDRERCLRAGASKYLPKPVDTDQLLALLRVAFLTSNVTEKA